MDSEIIITRNSEDITEQISLRMYWLLLCVTLTGLSVARAVTGELDIVVCRVGSVRAGELCYVYYRRLLLMLTCRATVSEGKQVETVFVEGRNDSLRTSLHNLLL